MYKRSIIENAAWLYKNRKNSYYDSYEINKVKLIKRLK